jgi:hypothetical protein
MVRRSPRLAAVSQSSVAEPPRSKQRGRQDAATAATAATASDNQSTAANSFEVELDIGSILGTIAERLFEHTSHRLFDYYVDLISSTYEKGLQLDYICNLFEIAIQTMTLTRDSKKREALFSALNALNESVFGMMDVPMAKKIRLNTAIRHLEKL